jgi:hypothetical protein
MDGILVNKDYGEGKRRKELCQPIGSSEFQKGVNHSKKSESIMKNVMVFLK